MRYHTPKIPEMYARLTWCRQVFGEHNENITWQRIKGRIHFRRQQDLTCFLLRWT
jgi:hypothetical protein